MKDCKIYVSINEAAAMSGLSKGYIRNRCRSGSIPCLMSGTKYLINYPLLIETLNNECYVISNRSEGVLHDANT